MLSEPEKAKNQPDKQNSILMFLMGLLLLLPALKVGYDIRLQPALFTAGISMTEYDIMHEPEYIGTDNYQRLASDRVVGAGLQYGLVLVMMRLFVLAIVPPAVGLLAGAGNRLARSINRLVLSVTAGLTIPVALALLWRIYWSQMWGMERSPIFDPNYSLASPQGARDLLMILDALITIGTGGAAGITVFMAVMRGHSITQSVSRAGMAVWFCVLLAGFITLSQTFLLPQLLTQGGPANSTMTPGLVLYQYAFRNFSIGYAAAIATLMIAAVIPAVVLIWLVLEISRLRLTTVPSSGGGAVGFVALPILLLLAIPLVGLVVWGSGLAADGYAKLVESPASISPFATIAAPWQAVWLIQLPVTWLAGFALGFLRPGGRVVTALLFLLLLVMVSIPDEPLLIAWLLQGRDAGIISTPPFFMVPWQIGALPLIVFKLFFDGAQERYRQAVQAGASSQNALISQVLLPSLLPVLVVGAVLSFQSAQDFTWSVIANNERDLMPLTVRLMQMMGGMGIDTAMLTAGAATLIMPLAAVFIPVFALLHLLAVDRFALVAGRSSTVKNEEAGI